MHSSGTRDARPGVHHSVYLFTLPFRIAPMKLLSALLLLLAWGGAPALAQETNPPDPVPSTVSATIEQVVPQHASAWGVLDLINDPEFSASILFDASTLGSSRSGNEAQILQRGDGNYVFLQQSGIANVARVSVNGDDNQVYGRQNDDQNFLEVSILDGGSNNIVPIVQDGGGNVLSLTLDGLNDWTTDNLPVGFGLFGVQEGAFRSPTGMPVDALVQSSVGAPIPLRIEVRRGGGPRN